MSRISGTLQTKPTGRSPDLLHLKQCQTYEGIQPRGQAIELGPDLIRFGQEFLFFCPAAFAVRCPIAHHLKPIMPASKQ